MQSGKRVHFYLDEAYATPPGSEQKGNPDAVVLVGGVSLPRAVKPSRAEWCLDLFEHSHAVAHPDRNRVMADRHAVLGEGTLRAMADKRVLPGGRFHVAGCRTRGREHRESTGLSAVFLSLVLQVILERGLGEGDELVLYPDRQTSALGHKTAGRFEGLVAAMRWLPRPPRGFPKVRVEIYPDEPGVMIGQSLADLLLWNLRNLARPDLDGWRGISEALLQRLGLTSRTTLYELPPLDDGPALACYLRLITGRLRGVDWPALATGAGPELARALKDFGARLSTAERLEALSEAHRRLVPIVEDTSLARSRGASPQGVLALVESLTALLPRSARIGAPKPAERPAATRHAYLEARALSHIGRTLDGARAWERWDRLRSSPTSPKELLGLLEGLNARAVLLTDLRRYDEVEGIILEELDQIQTHLTGFERSPERGRALGSLGQCYVLRGDPGSGYEYLMESAAQFRRPDQLSYSWTWRLVALGRGATPPEGSPDAGALAAAALEGFGLEDQAIDRRHFLWWGVMEALANPASGGSIAPALRASSVAAARALMERPSGQGWTHPEPLILRALGVIEGESAPFQRSLDWTPTDGIRGDIRARLGLRTVAAWGASVPPERAPGRAARKQRMEPVVRAAAAALGTSQPALVDYLEAFVALEVDDAEACRAFLALGDY